MATRKRGNIDTVRASRAGHSFHDYWAARRSLQLVFPRDNLHAIAVEGLSSDDDVNPGREAQEIADLVLYFGNAATFAECDSLQILQFKYLADQGIASASYLHKTIVKFAKSLVGYEKETPVKIVSDKLSFGFVTNAEFSPGLWTAIRHLKAGSRPPNDDAVAIGQYDNLIEWTKSSGTTASHLFPLIEFRAAEKSLPSQKFGLRRALTDWSSGADGQAQARLHNLINLVQEKAGLEGQYRNLVRREDVLEALNCDPDQLFPAQTQFVDVGPVVPRQALDQVERLVDDSLYPVFIDADGGVGKTVFVEDLSRRMSSSYEVVLFDCFGGGTYRSDTQERHLPKVGLVQVTNELASRGLCDPLLPSDGDSLGILAATRKRLAQAVATIRAQSQNRGILIIIDAADNAQLEADRRDQESFPRLLLASLSESVLDGVKLVLTARPHRMAGVVQRSKIVPFNLPVFSEKEARDFVLARKPEARGGDLQRALARSGRNARVLAYLVRTWQKNVDSTDTEAPITATDLIAQQCADVFASLDVAGWPQAEVVQFFTALARLPPPIPLEELAAALNWDGSQIASAAADLAPMLEIVPQGAIFRDEPTETYISETFGDDPHAQRAISDRLAKMQSTSEYAAEVLPNLLVGIDDIEGALKLAASKDFPASVRSEYSRRRLTMARLKGAFRLALKHQDRDTVLGLLTRLSQVAAANARGDDFIRRAPGLAVELGDRDVPRRLFNDRTGWRGARDARLTIAHTFAGELEEARLHSGRVAGWINWYWSRPHEPGPQHGQAKPNSFDFVAILLLSLVQGEFAILDRNLDLLGNSFGTQVMRELCELAREYEKLTGTQVLRAFEVFVAGPECHAVAAKLVVMSEATYLRHDGTKVLARSIEMPFDERQSDETLARTGHSLNGAIAEAAFAALMYGSRASARRLLRSASKARPSAHDYSEYYGASGIWTPALLSCLRAWVEGRKVRLSDLLPREVKTGPKARAIRDEGQLTSYLSSLKVVRNDLPNERTKTVRRRRKSFRPQFSERERHDIVAGIGLVFTLIEPLQSQALKAPGGCSPESVAEFIKIWSNKLRPLGPRVLERPVEFLSRILGLRIALYMVRHAQEITQESSHALVDLLTANRFYVTEKIDVLRSLVSHPNLTDVAGDFAIRISKDIRSDDRVEERGRHFADLAATLLLLSVDEARTYYRQGLAELDQMGADDYDLLYAMLRFAARQRGGFLQPMLGHRLMNLVQTICSDEPSKFGWTLFGEAAGRSIGLQAIFKLLRWDDQDVAEYSYGLPQVACSLAANGSLDARRAAVLLLVSKDHGWWDWNIGDGLAQLFAKATEVDRRSIFSVVFEKLKLEHPGGYRSSLWESLLALDERFPGLILPPEREELEALRGRAQSEAEQFNSRNGGSWDRSLGSREKEPESVDAVAVVAELIKSIDPASAADLDAALQRIEVLPGVGTKQFLDRVRKNCPYEKRLGHMLALCETASLDIKDSLFRLSDALEEWKASTTNLADNAKRIVQHLLSFKVTDLFSLKFGGSIDREIERLSQFGDDHAFVVESILRAVASGQHDLNGEEWLSLATSLSTEASAGASLEALDAMLSSPAARLADEIGEGAFQIEFQPKASQPEFMADVFWHLLGHSDAYIRWPAARAIAGMARLGLQDDLVELVSRYDSRSVPALASKDHLLSFQNSQQWLLMGIARASVRGAAELAQLQMQLGKLAARADIHVINLLQISRVLTNLPGGASDPMARKLASSLELPPRGFGAAGEPRAGGEPKSSYRFEYEFDKVEIEALSRLFGIPKGEAIDAVAAEIAKRWPDAESVEFGSSK